MTRITTTKKFYSKLIRKERPVRVYPPINEKGEQVTKDLEKAEVLSEFFASVFTGSQASYFSQVPEPPGGGWGN